jgi:hypothetical protein
LLWLPVPDDSAAVAVGALSGQYGAPLVLTSDNGLSAEGKSFLEL